MSSSRADPHSVEWPDELPRRSESERTSTRKFRKSLAGSFSELEDEIDRIGVDDYRYSFGVPARKSDDRPYRDARPDDPSFVLRWSNDGEQFAVGCDKYTSLRDNVRAVGLYIAEKRKMENRPVATAESEFATARLPPGDDEGDVVVAREPPHKVLGVSPDAPDAVVRGAFRELAKKYHGDTGDGDARELKRIQEARDEMLDGGE